jgi:hypothetical protein
MRDDYRRGRAALGFLSGTRPNPPVPARRRRLRRLGPAAALVVIAAASTVIVGSSLNHASRPTPAPNVSVAVASAGPRATVLLVDQATGADPVTVPAREFDFDTWAQASAQATFAVREPGWIPDGYWLSALQSFQPSATPDGDLLDSIVATYTGPNGDYLIVDQFWLADPSLFDLNRYLPQPPAGIGHGVAMVASHSGRWQAGKLTLDDAGNPARWDPSVTVLAWLDGQKAFRLEGHGPDLAALVRVGASVDR